MPEGYLKIKEKFIKDGMSEKEAETHAARIWNAKHPNNPVGNKKHEDDPEASKIMIDEDLL